MGLCSEKNINCHGYRQLREMKLRQAANGNMKEKEDTENLILLAAGIKETQKAIASQDE